MLTSVLGVREPMELLMEGVSEVSWDVDPCEVRWDVPEEPPATARGGTCPAWDIRSSPLPQLPLCLAPPRTLCRHCAGTREAESSVGGGAGGGRVGERCRWNAPADSRPHRHFEPCVFLSFSAARRWAWHSASLWPATLWRLQNGIDFEVTDCLLRPTRPIRPGLM